MARKALTQQELYNLYKAAEAGSSSALATLRESSKYYGKKGNERLTAFEKAGISSSASTRAAHYLQSEQGRDRFSRSGKLSAWDAYKNASEARRFIRGKTGTVAREMKRQRSVFEKLEKGGYLPERMTEEKRQKFSRFLSSGAWDEIKNTFGSQTMKDIAKGIQQGNDIDELMDAYQDYESGEIDIEDFLEGWVEV